MSATRLSDREKHLCLKPLGAVGMGTRKRETDGVVFGRTAQDNMAPGISYKTIHWSSVHVMVIKEIWRTLRIHLLYPSVAHGRILQNFVLA